MSTETLTNKSPRATLARRMLLEGKAPTGMQGDRARWWLEDQGLWANGQPTPRGLAMADELRAKQRTADHGF